MRYLIPIIALFISLSLTTACVTTTAATDSVVDRPEELTFLDLSFDLPSPAELRLELANGTPVYAK